MAVRSLTWLPSRTHFVFDGRLQLVSVLDDISRDLLRAREAISTNVEDGMTIEESRSVLEGSAMVPFLSVSMFDDAQFA